MSAEAAVPIHSSTPKIAIPSSINKAEALATARAYVTAQIDPAFEVVNGTLLQRKAFGRDFWRFHLCCAQGPVGVLFVDPQTNQVIELSDGEIRTLREKAEILAARQEGILPVNEAGYVLAEYARQQASRYLDGHLTMQYSAIDPVFVCGDPALWQVTIQFRLRGRGPLTSGVMDVDATTGNVIPLTSPQIQQIRERTRAIIGDSPLVTAA